MEINDEIEEDRMINEEYKIWKENTPFLYDLVVTRCLEWPSLTVQWLPDREEPPGEDHSVQKLILGTQALDDYPNYLLLAEVHLPLDVDLGYYDDDRSGLGGVSDVSSKLRIIQRISHEGEVNRARYMPQNNTIIATRAVNGEVFLFDYSKHPRNPPSGGRCRPDLVLKGHSSEGVGISWSPSKEGYILSSGNDARICLWDTKATPENKSLDALRIFKVHKGGVEDVAWHLKHEYMFGSVGEDHHLLIWDLRTPAANRPIHSVVAHRNRANCLSFNPLNEWVLATGSVDETVKLFDLRRINTAIYTFDAHKEEVFQVAWSPKNETILASSCVGRRVMVWDLSRIGEVQTPEDAVDGPPELLFIHGGHTEGIPDFSWNPCDDWVIASVAGDNIVQIWQMAANIYDDDDEVDLLPDDPLTNAP